MKDPRSVERGHGPGGESVAVTAETLLTFENTPLPLSVLSSDARIVMANRALRVLLGYGFNQLVGRCVFDIVAADPTDSARWWKARFDEREMVTGERPVRLRCADGSTVALRSASVAATNANGDISYLIVRFTPEPP